MRNEIQENLEKLAYKRSRPFCYQCYEVAPKGTCSLCKSDDLMREVPGVGVEYGTEWIINHILETELTPVDLEDAFEESVRQCYPEETKIGWMTFDTVTLMKENDPISWQCALSEYESHEESEGNIISFDNGSKYYWSHEVEQLLEEN